MRTASQDFSCFSGQTAKLSACMTARSNRRYEVLDLADDQLLNHLRLLSGLNRPFPARSATIHTPSGLVKSDVEGGVAPSYLQINANNPSLAGF